MEDKIIALIPKFSALLSMGGSGFIMYDVIKTGSVMRATQSRILLGMSFCDFWVSCSFFISTWAEPIDLSDSVYAMGNQLTCNIQGFLHQFSLAVVLYNAVLSAYYVAKIRYQCTDKVITRWLEPFLHAIPWLFGLGTASAAWALDLYNGKGWGCWIESYPKGCQEVPFTSEDQIEVPCERGDNATILRWGMYFAPLWAAILMAFVNMFLVYRGVYLQEQKMNRFNFHYQEEKKRLEALHEQHQRRATRSTAEESDLDDDDDAYGSVCSAGNQSQKSIMGSVGSAAVMATSAATSAVKSTLQDATLQVTKIVPSAATSAIASGTSAVKSTLQDASTQVTKIVPSAATNALVSGSTLVVSGTSAVKSTLQDAGTQVTKIVPSAATTVLASGTTLVVSGTSAVKSTLQDAGTQVTKIVPSAATTALASGTTLVASTLQDASTQVTKIVHKMNVDAALRVHFKHSSRVARQGYWFCGAFVATWAFPTIAGFAELILSKDEHVFPLHVLTAFFVPLHGFFIFICHIQPRVSKWLKRTRPGWYKVCCCGCSRTKVDRDVSGCSVTSATMTGSSNLHSRMQEGIYSCSATSTTHPECHQSQLVTDPSTAQCTPTDPTSNDRHIIDMEIADATSDHPRRNAIIADTA